MLRIAVGTIRSRAGGIVGALVGVAVAGSLVVSSGIVLESTLRAQIPVDRLDEAAIVVHRGQSFSLTGGETDDALPEQTRIDGRLAARLAALPGVERAIGDRTFPAELADLNGRPVAAGDEAPSGHGWSSAALAGLVLKAGAAPRAASEIVLDAGPAGPASVRIGDRVSVATATGRGVFTVAGLAGPRPLHGPSSSPAAYFRDDVAARLSGTGGRVDLIGLTVRPGTDVGALAGRVRELAGPLGLSVLTGSKRGEAESLDGVLNRVGLLSGLGVLAGFGLFVAIFVVASAFALSVQQRHRELALLRAIGATPRQVRRMVAAEALVVAVVGTILAVPLGALFAVAEVRAFEAGDVIPPGFSLVVGWIPAAVGLAAAIVTTQLASFVSGRRASRVRPVDALRESAVEQRPMSWVRGLAGVAVLLVGIAFFVSTTRDVSGGGGSDAPAAGLIWMLAATLLGPLLALPFVWLVGVPLQALSRGPGMLARASSRASLRRLTSVATPLMLTISLACALLVARGTVEHLTSEQAARSVTAQHVLVPSGDGLTPDVAAAARRLPGVSQVAATYPTTIVVARGGNPTLIDARAADGPALAGAVDLDVAAGSVAALQGETIAADDRLARSLGWHVGDRVGVWLGDGTPARLRVVALFRRPLGFGHIVVPRSVTAAHVTAALDETVFVATAPGDAGRGAAAGLEGIARAHGNVQVLDRMQYLGRVGDAARRQSIAAYVILGVVVLFAGIAAVNALAVAVSERGRDLELLRLIGATRSQLTRVVRYEVLIVVVFATVVGVLTAAPGAIAFSYGESGSPMPTIPVWLWAGLPLAAALLAFVGTALPLRSALRASRGSVTAGAQ